NGSFFVSTGTLSPVTVSDGRQQTRPGWSVSGQVSDFASGPNSFTGNDLGWTPKITQQDPLSDVIAGPAIAAGANPPPQPRRRNQGPGHDGPQRGPGSADPAQHPGRGVRGNAHPDRDRNRVSNAGARPRARSRGGMRGPCRASPPGPGRVLTRPGHPTVLSG